MRDRMMGLYARWQNRAVAVGTLTERERIGAWSMLSFLNDVGVLKQTKIGVRKPRAKKDTGADHARTEN
jgi:hypothetical protein